MFSVAKILVPVDFTDVSRAALSAALGLAQYHGAELWVLSVHEGLDSMLQTAIQEAPKGTLITDIIEAEEAAMREAVQLETQRLLEGGHDASSVTVNYRVSGGKVLEVCNQMVDDLQLNLIVTGTHGPKGIKGVLLGSISERLVEKATCSVLVVKPKGYPYLRD